MAGIPQDTCHLDSAAFSRFGIGVNRPAFGGTVPHFHQMSRGPAKSADVPHFFENGIIIFFVADYSTCLPRNATK